MKLHIIGSSSKGNAYLLQANSGEVIVLEMGIKFIEIQKVLSFNISNILACLITHEHGDHAKYVSQAFKARIPVYMSQGTFDALKTKGNALICHHMVRFDIGEFQVIPFHTQHDAAEPLGFLIRHPECGTLLFATDTYFIKYRFPNLRHVLIECNFSEEILQRNVERGIISIPRRNRTLQSHMSLETCIEFFHANDLSQLENIVLLHLSADNSRADQFQQVIEDLTKVNTFIAEPNLTIPLFR